MVVFFQRETESKFIALTENVSAIFLRGKYDKQWSDTNKQMQQEINSKATFKSGIETLFSLRNILFQQQIIFNSLNLKL